MTELAVNPTIAATLRRSVRRRSIGIKVHRGQVVVSAPATAPLQDIKHFVQQKSAWIERHLLRQRQQLSNRQTLQYASGDTVSLLGQPLILDVSTSTQHVCICGGKLLLGVDQNQLHHRKSALASWYIQCAQDYLPGRIEHYQQMLGVRAKGLKIRHYKTRWGSCNRRGELQFNWLLMVAPAAVVDYVVVHELAHLRHFNHSLAFWEMVASVMPDYALHRQWLRSQTTVF